MLCLTGAAQAQQFNSDNQWVAPHGVGTLVVTAGQHYSTFLATAALLPDTEFNIGLTRFGADPQARAEVHYSGTFYVKHRMYENKAETGGWALLGGTGISPSYLQEGERTDTFRSWWANAAISVPFHGGDVLWDLLPGFVVNLNKDQKGVTAWGATYSTRLAVYKIIPHSALVGEIFGTTGEAHAEPQFRAGIRWESEHLIIAATYGRAFDGSPGPGFELGFLLLGDPHRILCIGGGC